MSVNHPNETLDSRVFGRNRYKFLALTAIILLALSSILTSTVTLRFSAGSLNNFSDDIAGGSLILDDFDIIEIEAREKAVKHMWDAYINDRRIKLQPFWQAAFVAAYEDLSGDVAEVREAAISEIAKMSFYSTDIRLPDLEIESTALQLQELLA
ncbi:uncharacterized protein LOC111901858 [Lactuca sativa]|uniref:Uncharacterized protein n=1 Tax=Lactuca sativa TaxID=4236 RepID=A0A9R1VWB6_LACSA|nr:uncharacterized protein LOC111901858 [Lactuca sativa]KAJ0212010.1 hypothetical protein LSAT_V11C400216070 [Lactuca sativa]